VEFEYFRDRFAASASAGYAPGDQIFISYGAQSNDSLLQYYGFTEPGNPHDEYVIESATVAGPRTSSAGESANIKVLINGKGSFAPETLAAATSAAGGGDAEALRVLLAAVEREIASKPTRLEDDERQLQTPHLMSPRQRAAAEFRAEKKRLLEKCVKKTKKRLGKLEG
jgi:hypothetical protein